MTHRLIEFGNTTIAVVERRNGPHAWLTVTRPVNPGKEPDWAELERILQQPGDVPEAS